MVPATERRPFSPQTFIGSVMKYFTSCRPDYTISPIQPLKDFYIETSDGEVKGRAHG